MTMDPVSRRDFLQASAAGAVTAAVGTQLSGEGADQANAAGKTEADVVPRRQLGRTKEMVSIINLGTARSCDQRLLNAAYDSGVRYLDTARKYMRGESERQIATWLKEKGRREGLFLVTKDTPKKPEELDKMLDDRLAALGIDQLDLLFIHGLCGGFGGSSAEQAAWPGEKAWGKAADQLKASKRVRFVGFSSHAEMELRIESLKNAAAGGWVDAIMVAADPIVLQKNKEFDQALEACAKEDIGLICMKEMRAIANAPKDDPLFANSELTPHQAVLHYIWSDGRFASICSNMPNVKILKENTTAARKFKKPMGKQEHGALMQYFERHAAHFCPGCDGRCAKAAGTHAALNDIVRYLAYYEQDGDRDTARELFRALPADRRDWSGADLKAAQRACVCHLDFAALMGRAQQKLT
jgi:predicted aldo/keto reductase-like oxidoreductase